MLALRSGPWVHFALAAVAIVPAAAGAANQVRLVDGEVVQRPQGVRANIRPRIDYHEHVNSPFEASVPETLSGISLPSELSRLIREREALAGKAEASKLFAENGQIVEWGSPSRWVRGREEIARVLPTFTHGYRYLPNAYSVSNDLVSITGVTVRGEPPNQTYGSNFVLVLQKDRSGSWRILSEFLSPRNSPPPSRPLTADDLIAEMNDAGIERAILISSAHTIASPLGPQLSPEREHARVRQENDWAAAEVAKYPQRLVGFCSINPLRDWAVAEMVRCSAAPGVTGIKMHFFTSQVDLLNPDHVRRLQDVVREANARKLPLLIHLLHRPGEFGRPHAEVFLEQILPEAPDIAVQLAHLAVSYDNQEGADAALGVFADAIAADDPRTRNLYFDTAAMPHPASSQDEIAAITKRLRQIGMDRILFGSDGVPEFPRSAVAWADFRWLMPLTDEELSVIASNVAPYMRR